MKNLDQAVKELEDIIAKNVNKYKFPEINGKSIRIGELIIRHNKKSRFVIVDIKNNKTIETTYSKSGAIAFSLAFLKKKNYKNILFYDSVIEKHVNDSHFYSNVIKKTEEVSRKEALLNRFEESRNKIDWAKSALDDCILEDFG
jgi:hypothetical protein